MYPVMAALYWGGGGGGVKLLEHKAVQSPISSKEVKNVWSYTSKELIRFRGE
jgi:hypothetical protein